MSYFDDASLVMIPSGYKTSKVYSVKPTSGDGDLTFTRSNDTATRVGPDGLIEKVRTNLLLQSQAFENADWTKNNATITANATAAPDGTVTADKLIMASGIGPTTATTDGCLKTSLSLATGTYTYSVFAKSAEFTGLRVRENAVVGSFLEFDLSTGIAPAGSAQFINPTMVNAGSGWYRCSWTSPSNMDDGYKYSLRVSGTGDGTSGIFIWGAQLESGDIATDYIATTSAAVSVGPVANVPRLDYLNSSCPRLLLEGQRTNMVLFSEQFNNAAYSSLTAGSATAAIVTANFATSPDGYQNADRLQFSRTGTTSSDLSLLLQNAIVLSATGTATIYLKSNTSSTQNVLLYWGGGQGIVFAVTPEWQRFTLPNLAAGTDTILIGTRGGSGSFFNGGDLTLDVLAYGFQIEEGAYATSYIPTLGAAVTRGADAASKTGISSLIGQTEGTLFIEIDRTLVGAGGQIIEVENGTDAMAIQFNTSNVLQCYVYIGASASFPVLIEHTLTTSGNFKIAFAYKQNDFVVYVNGTQVGSDTSGSVPLCNVLRFVPSANVKNSQYLLFPTRLSNADLAALTA